MPRQSLAARTSIVRAMALGAGKGSRMRELTRERAKPMVKVSGRPLVDHVLDQLLDAGVVDVVVNVHHMADAFEDHLRQRTAPAVTISDERDELLDTGGGVTKALAHFGTEPFFIHNADSIWRENSTSVLRTMIDTWNPERMDCLMLLADPALSLGYDGLGDFVLGHTGNLRRRAEGDTGAQVFAGVSIVHHRMFIDAPAGAFSLNVLWDRLIVADRLFGIMLDGQWMHVGTPEAVEQAEAIISQDVKTTARGAT